MGKHSNICSVRAFTNPGRHTIRITIAEIKIINSVVGTQIETHTSFCDQWPMIKEFSNWLKQKRQKEKK